MHESTLRWLSGLAHLGTFSLGWAFCLPGAAVLVEIVRYGRIPMPVEIAAVVIVAIVLAACLLADGILARTLGWAIACLGHAALINAMVPDRPANFQLIWLAAGTALGFFLGLLAGTPRRQRQSDNDLAPPAPLGSESVAASPLKARPLVGRLAIVSGGVVIGLVAVFAVRYEIRVATQARIAETVARSAGHTIYDHPGTPPLLFKWLDRICEGDKHLCLRSVELGAGAGDDELAELTAMGLESLPYLRELRLRSSMVTDVGLVRIVPLVALERLTLGRATTDVGLVQLNGLPDLRTLDLSNTCITGDGLGRVGPLPALTFLNLQSTRVTSGDLAQLKGFPQLCTLDLSATPIDDTGLAHLKDLPHLSSLILFHTPITDAGLKHVAEIPQLKWLFVSGSKVTRAGLDEFHRTKPNVWTD